jgi:ubiquinone/menaquinone biosynthesis C-methylase UbiE
MPSQQMSMDLLKKFDEVEKIHWWWEGRRELLKVLMRPNQSNKILDIGCGTGETLTFLEQTFPGSSVYGVDNYQLAVNFTKKRGHKKIYKASAYKLPFRNNSFDIVLFLDVLEHLKDDWGAIKEAKRVLKPGGKIIITSPALSFIWSNHDTAQGHQRRYTRHQISQLAAENNLKITFISYFNFFLCFPIIAVRLISKNPIFKFMSDYDNDLNFNIIYNKLANGILRLIFVSEIKALKYIGYPIGISIAVVMEK